VQHVTEQIEQSEQTTETWMTQETHDLATAVADLQDPDEALRSLRDLCTVRELQELGQRWHVARLLSQGVPYQQISERTGASSATVSRVNQWLRYGRSGYRTLIDRLDAASTAARAE
jgi:TrpR-related protein YerC/YecD